MNLDRNTELCDAARSSLNRNRHCGAMRRRINAFIVPFLLAILCVLLQTFAIFSNSYVYNEHARLASGLAKLINGDFSVFRVSPPLPDAVSALPLLLSADLRTPSNFDYGVDRSTRVEYLAGDLFLEKNANHLTYVRIARFANLLFSILGIFTCYFYANWLFGRPCGLVASLLWLFSPMLFGYGGVLGSDVPSAALALTTFAAFHYWLSSNDDSWTFRVGVLLGLAQLTKFTLLIFYPLTLAIFLTHRLTRSVRRKTFGRSAIKLFVLIYLPSILVLNAGYLFKGTMTPLKDYAFHSRLFSGMETGVGNRFADAWLGALPVPLPRDYLLGIDCQRLDFETGLTGSYFRGEQREHGWFNYYLCALGIKTPTGTLALLLIAIILALSSARFRTSWRDELILWLPGLALILFVSSQTGFSIHSRYVLPALPFFIVAVSRIGRLFSQSVATCSRRRVVTLLRGACVTLGIWSLSSFLLYYPNEIAHFNELTSLFKPKSTELQFPLSPVKNESSTFVKLHDCLTRPARDGSRWLLGSNLDWGQNYFRLAEWLQNRHDVDAISIDLDGSYPCHEISPKVKSFLTSFRPGWHAISVNNLLRPDRDYDQFLRIRPIAVVGYSIYIYHVTEEEAQSSQARDYSEIHTTP